MPDETPPGPLQPVIPGAMTTIPPQTIPPQAAQTIQVPAQVPTQPSARKRIKKLAQSARQLRQAFNEGWEDSEDMGILNEVVSTELEVYHLLKNTPGIISSWDKVIENDDPMLRIRLLRRYPGTCSCFAASVSAAMLANSMMRPTTRPTRFIIKQTSANAAMHFQMLVNCVYAARGDLLGFARTFNEIQKNRQNQSVLFIDYHPPVLGSDYGYIQQQED